MVPAKIQSGDPESFWAWFVQNEKTFAKQFRSAFESNAGNCPAGDAIAEALEQYREGLRYEIGRMQDGRLDLVVSADGIFERFPSVTGLISRAPQSQDFRFTAFRQRSTGMSLNMHGITISPEQCLYEIEPSNEHPKRFDLCILIDAPSLSGHDLRQFACILLDSTIGEYDMETLIAGLDVQQKSAVGDYEMRSLDQLPAELDRLAGSQRLQ